MMLLNWIKDRKVSAYITEKQLDGAIVLVVFAVVIYIVYSLHHVKENVPPKTYASKETVIIEIAGDTSFNGIYFLPYRMFLSDALKSIGISIRDVADRSIIQRCLTTGKTILIKKDGLLNISEMSNQKKLSLDIPIDINMASSIDLLRVPGIGEKTAKKILDFKRMKGSFKELEELMQIPGIKEKQYKRLKKYFCVAHPKKVHD